jgi:hypothetical protein
LEQVLALGPNRLATVGRDAVRVFSAHGKLLQTLPGMKVPVHDAAFMGDGRLMIARQDGKVDVIDTCHSLITKCLCSCYPMV